MDKFNHLPEYLNKVSVFFLQTLAGLTSDLELLNRKLPVVLWGPGSPSGRLSLLHSPSDSVVLREHVVPVIKHRTSHMGP